jgi:hypothetical protein
MQIRAHSQIDDPYTFEQLQSPRINVAIVRPLIERLYDPEDISTGQSSQR